MDATAEVASAPLVMRSDDGPIATLTLNRPDKFNALSVSLMDALLQALEAVRAEPAVRVVVLAATGKAFCTGHDLKEMRAHPDRPAVLSVFQKCTAVMTALARIPQPVIARVHGVATAAGCQLVASCDLAIAAAEARFAVSGVNLGLFCSTPMVALTRNLPRKQAMEMLLTGAFVDAETACRWGLVNRVVPAAELDDAVRSLAAEIAGKSPAAIAFGKRLFYRQLEASIDAAYAAAAQTMADNMLTEDAQAGIDAFLARQPLPEWRGR